MPTASPARRPVWWSAVSALVVVAVLVCYLAIWGRRYGLDLMVYRDSVRSWRAGADPYLHSYTRSRLPFTYPPFALVFLAPLSWPPFADSQWLLWAADLAAACASVVLVARPPGARRDPRVGWAALAWAGAAMIVLEPARSGADYGQIEFVLMLLVVVDLLAVRSPFRGILIGVAAAVKLTPLVFLVVLAVRRDGDSVLRALGSFLVWTGATWLLWPAMSHRFWAHDVSQPGRTGPVAYPSNLSWYAVLHRAPFPAHGSTAAWALLSLVTLAAATVVAWRCTESGRHALAMLAIALAGLMISPISWSHHWDWVLLIPPLLLSARGAEPRSVRILLWGIVVLAALGPYWWFGHGALQVAAEAVVPLWTFVLLVVWAAAELAQWRRRQATAQPTTSDTMASARGGTSP